MLNAWTINGELPSNKNEAIDSVSDRGGPEASEILERQLKPKCPSSALHGINDTPSPLFRPPWSAKLQYQHRLRETSQLHK